MIIFDYNGKLAMESRWLWENGVMSYDNYKIAVRRKKITVLHRSAPGCPAIIEYNSLPYYIKNKVDQKLQETGSASAVQSTTKAPPVNFFEPLIQPDQKAMDFFSARFPGDFEKINRHYVNAIVLGALLELKHRRLIERKSRCKTGRLEDGLFSSLISDLKSLSSIRVNDNLKYPHTLPVSERNLRPLLKEYQEKGYVALIHANGGNNYARKVTADMELLFLSIYGMDNKPYAEWVYEYYIDFMEGKREVVNYKTGEMLDKDDFTGTDGEVVYVSESTVWSYLNKPENKLVLAAIRSDSHTFRHKYLPHTMRKAAEYSLNKISFDDVNLPLLLEGGGHIYAYYAFDTMSGMIIGAAYSLEKDEKLFINCLRNMYHNLNKWGYGMPIQGEFEHHICGKFKNTMLMPGNLFERVTYCAPTNSQAKEAERHIRKKKYCAGKQLRGNVGRHYAKLEANVMKGVRYYNEETNEYEFKEKRYSYEQIVAEDMKEVEYYNNLPHENQKKYPGKSIRDAFFAHINPEIGPMDNQRVFYYLGESQKTSIDRNQYINLQYTKYWLSSPDVLELLAPNKYSVTAHWMPDQDGIAMGEAYIYQDGRFISRVNRLEKFSAAIAEWTDADTVAKREQDKYISEVNQYVKRRKDRLMGLEFTHINRAIAETRAQDYIVKDVPVEEEIFAYNEWDAEYQCELAREKAMAI